MFALEWNIKRGSLYTAFGTKISKVDYSSQAKGFDIRGVGTFFVTCSNLDQLSQYCLKIRIVISRESSIKKFRPFVYCIKYFQTILKICVDFCFSGLVIT